MATTGIECVYLETIPKVMLSLRRFSRDLNVQCPGPYKSYHNAMAYLREEPLAEAKAVISVDLIAPPNRSDSRWPTKCQYCDYLFQPEDHFQVFPERLYRNTKTGLETVLKPNGSVPVGWMWDAFWQRDLKGYDRGPDGLCLNVKTPGGEWCIDGPANNGPGWTRTGTPPKITVAPSILAGNYHGWLRDGFLVVT